MQLPRNIKILKGSVRNALMDIKTCILLLVLVTCLDLTAATRVLPTTTFRGIGTFPSFYAFLNIDGFICGGIFCVTPRTVVASAHCFYEHSNEVWTSYDNVEIMDSDYTTLNWRYNPNWVPISHYVVHPDYNPTSFESVDDIAVVFLNEDLRHKEDILSLCPDQNLNFGIAVGVARRSSFYFATPSPLMISAIQINRNCRKLDDYHQDLVILQSLDLDHDKQICFDLSSASVVGFGDPRGPFVLQRDERGFCLLGVPSFILENNGYSKNMGVFAKISFYKEWIMEQLYMQAV